MTQSKNDLINLIVNSPSINETLSKVPTEYQDDFIQHFYLQLCEKSFEKLLEVHNRCNTCLEAFAGTIIKNQLKSNNSSFHYIFRKNLQSTIDLERTFEKAQYLEDNTEDTNRKIYESVTNLVSHLHKDLEDKTAEEIDRINQKNYHNILNFLRHIHPKKSMLFIEHYINSKSIKQISKQYNIKYRTVHHNIRLVEQLMREQLKFEID